MARRADLDAAIRSASGGGASRLPTGPAPLPDSVRNAFPKETNEKGRLVTGREIDLSKAARLAPIQRMTDNIANHAQRAIDNGLLGEAKGYYPEQHQRAAEIGKEFNDKRAARGLPVYHPEEPHLAGLLLSGGYSQNNSETNRNRMLERSMATGDVQQHLSTRRIEDAILSGRHPMETFGSLKLRDYTGSINDPEHYSGEFGGVQKGLGYTIDRHQHDLAHNRAYGEVDRGISGEASPINTQRYRAHQAANYLAHQVIEQSNSGLHVSRPAFQALGWGGWRGSFK